MFVSMNVCVKLYLIAPVGSQDFSHKNMFVVWLFSLHFFNNPRGLILLLHIYHASV